ncbi:periplasmic sensor hybrid histidine kinase [Magnetococcus marinus MC-1]|uniref:histidine kinase n=1 Tax=Magnetococcus marinus (strain ATCC BAA-1437 / JCM 17883 / MC-1) TaxID=156889 RepID=A0L524_MAGMM|nr:ATP-binding protein [Magnetococcus marinus]ABK43067.1 periplasmic sensor hybrid histidine kinase [Magnetococcus marinus MC-1]
MLPFSLPIRYAFYAFVLMGGGLLSIASYGFQQASALLALQTAQMVTSHVTNEISFLRDTIVQMRQDMDILLHSPVLLDYLDNPQGSPAPLSEQMIGIMQNRPSYAQFRLICIEDEGKEKIRIERRIGNIIATLVPAQLQTKGNRPYYKTALELPRGRDTISPIELNQEHGQVEHPIRPVMRLSTPVYDSHNLIRGVMVINLDFSQVVKRLATLDNRVSIRLIYPNGEYLYHPDATRMFTLSQGGPAGLFQEYPQLTWPDFNTLIEGEPFLIPLKAQHKLIAGQLIHLDSQQRSPPLIVLGVTSDRMLQLLTNQLAHKLTLIVLALVTLLTLLTAWMAYRLWAPLRDLTESAHMLAKSLHEGSIPHQNRQDEVGTLARAIHLLLQRLQHIHQRTQRFNEQLQTEVAQRTTALQETIALADERRSLLAEVQSMARIGGCAWDPTHDQLSVTEAFLQLTNSYGAPPTTLQDLLDLYGIEDRERLQHMLEIALQSGLKGDMVASLGGHNQLWLRTLLQPIRQGPATIKIHIVIQDITREHLIQEAHTREERRNTWLLKLNEVAYASGDALMELALQGAITLSASPQAFFIWMDSSLNHICQERLYPAPRDPAAVDRYRPARFAPSQQAFISKESVLHHAQAATDQPALVLPLFEDRQVIALLGVLGASTPYDNRDIQHLHYFAQGLWRVLQRRRDQEMVKQATAEAQRANAVKGRFLANMSHEIRTPMNAIMGFTELSLTQHPPAPHDRHLQAIRTASQTLLALLNDVLDFSKIDAEQLALEQIPFSPTEQLQQIAQMLAPQAQAKGLHFHTFQQGSMPTLLLGDALRLRQVLINLVSNAIKFTHQGKVVLGMYGNEPTPEGRCLLRFEVIDSGIGIEASQQERLFQPFVQGDLSTTRTYGGSGLGLAISKRLVHLMGGEMQLESTLGAGSKFSCLLPFSLCKDDLAKSLTPSAQTLSIPHWPDVTLLVAEDNRLNREMLQELLARAQIGCLHAVNGTEAVAMLERDNFPLHGVLMDMQMPQMDGLTATQLIRLHHPKGTLPIIAMTANGTAADRQRCLEAGMDDCLIKPIDMQTLYSTLRLWLPEPQGEEDPYQQPLLASQQRWQQWQPDPQLIDKQDLFLRLGGDFDRLMNRLGYFATECERYFTPLTHAYTERDTTTVLSAAHAMKGIAKNLSLLQLADYLERLEAMVQQHGCDAPGLSSLWQHLLTCQQATCLAMPAQLPPATTPPSPQLEADMTQFMALLNDNDLQAKALLQQLFPLLQQRGQGQLAADLENALAQFDFAQARALLQNPNPSYNPLKPAVP